MELARGARNGSSPAWAGGRRQVVAAGVASLLGLAGRTVGAQEASPAADPAPGETPFSSPAASAEAGASPSPEAAGAALEGTPAPIRGEMTVYSGRSENLVGPFFQRFTHETGIATEVRYAGTGELAATLLEEGANSPASAFFAQDAGALGLLAQEGLFAPLPAAVLDRVPERFRSPDGLWVGVTGRRRTLAYNIDAVPESELPASVLELTDPAWAGRIGWAPENVSFQAFVTALRLTEGEDAARAWLEAMIANGTVNFGDSNAAIVRAVGAGEVDAGLVNHYYLYAIRQDEGDDFPVANHFFAPEDPGSLINVAGIGILAAAPEPELALELVEALLSDEGQEYFVAETNEYPVVAAVAPPAGLEPLAETASPDLDLGSLADLRGTLDLLADVGLL
jgi:iron(III) transport system substrate-binding protein